MRADFFRAQITFVWYSYMYVSYHNSIAEVRYGKTRDKYMVFKISTGRLPLSLRSTLSYLETFNDI